MKKILEGVARFKREVYPQHREMFQQLARRQNPDVMLIACSDSRMVPSFIMQSAPGDLFVLRNAGNIVPSYGESAMGVAAAVEFAVQVLKVRHIIVCGHTDCGAMKAALHPETLAGLPALSKWMQQTERALAVVRETGQDLDDGDSLQRMIEENVVAQLEHLATHPSVAAKTRTGALALHGWVWDIGHGEVTIYDAKSAGWVSVDTMADTLAGEEQPVNA